MWGIECRRQDAWDDKPMEGASCCCGRGCQGVSQSLNDGSEGRGLCFYAHGERDVGDRVCRRDG